MRAANRTQAKGSTARLVVPRAPEVADEMGMELTDAQFLSVEEYLLERGYVASVDIGLTWSTYTLTPAGLRWLETSLPLPETLPTDRLREVANNPGEERIFESALRAELEEERRRMEELERELDEEPLGDPQRSGEGAERPEPRSSTVDAQQGVERPWWRRVFGG